jgi:hypothetical protein
VHALLRHRLQVPEKRIEPAENGGLLNDRGQRWTALQGAVDPIETTEQILTQRGDEARQSWSVLRPGEQAGGLLLQSIELRACGGYEVRFGGLLRDDSLGPGHRPLIACCLASGRGARRFPLSSWRSGRRFLCRTGLLPFLLLTVSPSLEERVEDVDQECDRTDVFCEKLPHQISVLSPPVAEHPPLERALTALGDQVGQDQARYECPRLSNERAQR